MSLYRRPESEVWWVDIRHAGQRVRRSTGETDRAAAQARHNEIQVELWTLVPVTDEHTWGDAVELWCNARERNAAELLSLAKFGRGFPDRGLSEITGEAIEQALAFTVAPSTYKRYRAMILSILNLARKRGWLAKTPVVATKHHKPKPRDWLTREQWEKLLAELPAHQKPMAKFSIETGLRQANVLRLRWDQVDIERRIAWFEADEMKGGRVYSAPLNDEAINVLKAQKGQHPEFVFTYKGQPIGDVKTAFAKACVRAGLGRFEVPAKDRRDPRGKSDAHRDAAGRVRRTAVATTTGGRDPVLGKAPAREYVGFTWHGFRHTWATWHVQNGTPLEVLQKLGGWADLRMVLNYAQHSPGHLASYAGNNRRKPR